ncbi:hypothetical protein LBMAG48_09320 [Phycisphaerae bacterium]|nr:hypothetical protein LBMAG48_09320 [Phycisphaerae bacterium]
MHGSPSGKNDATRASEPRIVANGIDPDAPEVRPDEWAKATPNPYRTNAKLFGSFLVGGD